MDDEKVKLLLTEDLSPHKITLLILINIYCNNKIPRTSLKSVLTLLINLISNGSLFEGEELVVIPTVEDLFKRFSDNGMESACLILDDLWNINSVEDLDSKLGNIYGLIVGSDVVFSDDNVRKISSRSLLGGFIYKVVTAFRLLKFEEVYLLYEAFVDYREPTREMYISNGGTIKVNNTDQESKDDNLFKQLNQQLLGSTTNGNIKYLPVPKHDLQVLLDKQIHLLESYGTPTPPILKYIMTIMTSPDSNICLIQNINFNNLPSYYYIKYLEALCESNYNNAFEALHQYFDYMVSNNSKYFYHFALISRASLHQFFGEDGKAIDAIEEAISVARENKDNATLTYILSWLFNFIKNKPELWQRQSFYNNNNESQLLNFLIKKSQLVSLLLYSLSFNFEALQMMNNGGSMNTYLESLLKATYISINDQKSSFIRSTEMAATVWSRVGNPILSDIYNDISIESTDKRTEKLSIQIRSNYLKFLKGETESSYQNLENMKKQVTSDNSLFNSIQVRSLIILTRLNLNKGRLKICKEIINILMENDIKELELKNELILLEIEIELSLENYSKALGQVFDNLNNLNNSSVFLITKLNLLKCRIYNASGNYSKGLTLIMQQIQRGKSMGFITVVVEGLLILMNALNSLNTPEDCYSILQEIMPTILSLDNKEYICQSYYELTRCCFAIYKRTNDSVMFSRVLRYLNLSILGYKKCVNLVMLTKCFQLEEEIAREKKDESLLQHATSSIKKMAIRSREESEYGYI